MKQQFRSLTLCMVVVTVFTIVPSIQAQSDNTQAKRIQAVSEKAKSARTATEYSGIIEECDALLGEDIQKTAHRKYVQKLVAWALDKRGATRVELATQFRNAGSIDQARIVNDQAATDFDRSLANDKQRWQSWMHRGTLRARQDQFVAAIQDFDQVIRLQPDSTSALFNRAELNFQLGHFEEALGDYDHVLQLDPSDIQSTSGRAHCLLGMKQFQDALVDYDAVVQRVPNDAWAFANRADAHLAMMEWQKAREDLEQSIALTAVGSVCRRLGWLLSTCPDESFCDGPAALDAVRQAIKLEGESIDNLDALAAAHAAAGQFERARDVHSRVVSMLVTEDPTMAVKQAAYEKNERYQETFDR